MSRTKELRREIEDAWRAELSAGRSCKRSIAARFADCGRSRTTIYRWLAEMPERPAAAPVELDAIALALDVVEHDAALERALDATAGLCLALLGFSQTDATGSRPGAQGD